ncbi:MAG TPA: hypothetical protein VHB79_15665 [Polyangiaceae bacterium]|nr:hypothetical protein [Polyangiaceae bacterium]
MRGLSARTEVRGRLISRTEIERYLSQQLDEETPKDVLEATEALLYGLGAVDADFNYRSTVIGLMTSELLGFYDPKQKTFFVGGDLSGEEADVTLWHELVHALQDQHYDLTHVTDWQPDQGDSQAAVHALAEGDATSAMLDAMLKPRGITALDVPDSLMRTQSVLGAAALTAPPILVRSLLAPYVDGLAFTNALRRRGGFATVDEAWKSPPISTEQLLHPEKFLAHEVPLVVPLPVAPAHAPALQERFHDVMGEQTLRVLLEEWLPAKTAAEAASGWGGDRISVFSDEARQRWAVAWHLRFDSEAASKRAFLALVRSAPLTERGADQPKLAPAAASPANDKLCRPRHTQGPLALVRRGPDLAIAVGPFTRTRVPVDKDPGCSDALAWAAQIVTN